MVYSPREGSKPDRAKTPEGGLARESPVRRGRTRHNPSRCHSVTVTPMALSIATRFAHSSAKTSSR